MDKYVPAHVLANQYHIEVLSEKLTRQLGTVLPPVMDELQMLCSEMLPTEEGGE